MNIAVILSSYNGEKYIAEQIESIISQDYVDVSLFIRDDGSTDNTKDILTKYAKNERIHVICEKNIGYPNSFFKMLFLIDGYDYYAFSDQDDKWDSNKLYAACNLIESNTQKKPTLYYSNLTVCDENLTPIKKTKLEFRKKTLESVITRRSIAGCTIVINKYFRDVVCSADYDKLNIFSHDNYLVTLCYAIGGNVIFDNNSYINYRQHRNNTSGTTIGIKKRIMKEIKEIKKGKNSESRLALNIIENYSDFLTKDGRDTMLIVSKFNSVKIYRLYALISPKFTTGNLILSIYGKIKIIFGI